MYVCKHVFYTKCILSGKSVIWKGSRKSVNWKGILGHEANQNYTNTPLKINYKPHLQPYKYLKYIHVRTNTCNIEQRNNHCVSILIHIGTSISLEHGKYHWQYL